MEGSYRLTDSLSKPVPQTDAWFNEKLGENALFPVRETGFFYFHFFRLPEKDRKPPRASNKFLMRTKNAGHPVWMS